MGLGVGSEAHGTARERHVREIAGLLGVADFVFAAPPIAKGAASREAAGDGLLVVGSRGAVIQVKAREPDARTTDTPEKAERWVIPVSSGIIAGESLMEILVRVLVLVGVLPEH